MFENLSKNTNKIKKFLRSDNIFASLIFLLFLSGTELFIYSITSSLIDDNLPLVYIFTYTFSIMIFYLLFFKDDLKKDAKNLKEILKENYKILIISFIIFTTLTIISNNLIIKYTGIIPINEELTRESLKSSPFLMGISVLLLGPITEELIYRMSYKNVKKHRFITYLFYSCIFALMHITNFTAKELLFLIPYLLLSLNFGFGLYKTNNIYVSIIIHILYNLINVMLLLIM